ncbi:ribonuclease P protein component [Chengkuizengella axinellae]|uniref:Ribonuclease P protein component n=1 Tax=Chengkuizengella axinellae TaxID=3064388 RepID=A0ABT9J398_9BACL|nr:ribonuclease P protein component [Chengkuizengella sp. 2205SS18-9]MDP5276079.1 ribonuclease P protein component [Chengkuizengella sp. 2205SS18-9]
MENKFRLKKREDFNFIYRYGKSTANHQFVVYYKQNSIHHFRLGISVSKKTGNAVVRNRMRRVIKEIARHHEDKIKGGYDLIIIVRKPAVIMDYHQIEKSILHVLRKASLIRKKNRGT